MITDVFLQEIAKAINGESFTSPTHTAFSGSVITPDPTDTSLPTELDRSATSGSRTTNEVTFTGIRSSATATPTTGDYINTVALFSASSGGNLFIEATAPNILHTDLFDLEVEATVTIERK